LSYQLKRGLLFFCQPRKSRFEPATLSGLGPKGQGTQKVYQENITDFLSEGTQRRDQKGIQDFSGNREREQTRSNYTTRPTTTCSILPPINEQLSLPTSLESDYQCLIRSLTCQSLNELPTELNLTPVKGKKPYLPDWQNLTLYRGQVRHQILANGATGYGLVTGKGLLAIDVDGPLADTRLNEISGRELPKTPSWTSNKPGRRQLVYRLSRSAQTVLDAVSFTRKFIDCGEGEQLDFRYNCCQSVLPPSFHPETGQYRWLVSFAEVDIAPAPEWLEALLVEWAIASRPKPKSITETAREYQEGRTIKHSLTQAWGDRVAPGRIRQNEGLMLRWNGLRITAKGQTNSVLLEFCRLLKESGINCDSGVQADAVRSTVLLWYPPCVPTPPIYVTASSPFTNKVKGQFDN
jgi:hypothetical protein